MKKIAVLAMFFVITLTVTAQKQLSDYSFVVIPEKYDFVSEADKYQLNSLTKFLFNKHGFNAYFPNELPDVRRCDGLWAQVDGRPGIIWTKVTIILNDCNGNEIHRSEEGRSKIKAYSKTYTAALRDAFKSIEELGVQQGELELFTTEKLITESNVETPALDVPISSKKEQGEAEIEKPKLSEKVPVFGRYSNNGSTFILRAEGQKFLFYELNSEEELFKGTLYKLLDSNFEFIDASGNKFPARFDTEGSLILETSFQAIRFAKEG